MHEKLTEPKAEEEKEEEEKEEEPRKREKKEGVARQFQRFGHWVTNDHPDYEPAERKVKPSGG